MASETAGVAMAVEAETLLTNGNEAKTHVDRGYRAVRLAAASSILLALGVLAAALFAKAPASRAAGGSRAAEEDTLQLARTKQDAAKAAEPLVVKKNSWTYEEDDIDMIEDPCKRRKLRRLNDADGLDDLKGLGKMNGSDAWDPCKVSKEAAVKAEKMLKQAAKWELHKKAKGKSDSSSTANKKGAKVSTKHAEQKSTASKHAKKVNASKQAKKVKEDPCAGPSEDCSKKKCCSMPGMQCFTKSKDWAECRDSCTIGPDPSDMDPTSWSCEEIGKRTPGDAPQCVQNGENCTDSKCCAEAGSTCFKKNETFAACKHYCTPGPDYTHADWGIWTCEALGAPKGGKADWVEEKCSGDEEDCSKTMCCQTSGRQCYEKGEGWAQCKVDCSTEPDPNDEWGAWTCKELGSRTPWPVPGWTPGPEGGKVAPWVKDHCSDTGNEDCSKTQCCRAVGAQCYQKEKGWAVCKESCTPGADPYDNYANWTCNTLGSRSYGLASKGWPSLFCFIVMRTNGYELPLVQAQWEARSGVFNCDGFVVFSDKVIDIAETKSLQTPDVEVGISKDGTAGNTALFMAIWDMLFEDGRLWLHDWTIKADPDAVVLPDRLRTHLAPHTGLGEHEGKLYVVNCNAWPSSPSFPMLYGAVEVFSNKAMGAYASQVSTCKDELPWSDWGEDFFLTRCMDQIGVGRLDDFTLVGDNLCTGPGQGGAGDCNSAERAAFHPFKKFDDWMNCFNTAIGRI